MLDIEDEAWEITFRANVLGPFRLCRGFGRGMLAAGGGVIINVLSGSAFQPTWQNAPYGSTKAALWAMTRYLSVELAPAIRVNALVPGLTMSETGGPQAGPVADSLLAMVPMGRAGGQGGRQVRALPSLRRGELHQRDRAVRERRRLW